MHISDSQVLMFYVLMIQSHICCKFLESFFGGLEDPVMEVLVVQEVWEVCEVREEQEVFWL